MGCRSSVRERELSSKSVLQLAGFQLDTLSLYLSQVKRYKLARFREVTDAPLVTLGLQNIEDDVKPVLPPFAELKKNPKLKFTQRDYNAAKAILHRFEFEVQFRQEQHRRGWAFGVQSCSGLKKLDQDCSN